MQSYTQFSNTQFSNFEFFKAVDDFGFNPDIIKAIMFDYSTEAIGIGGSFFLKFLLEKKNGFEEEWEASDIDIFVTDYSILEMFKEKFSWNTMREFQTKNNSIYSTMSGVTDVLEIDGDDGKKLQIVVTDKSSVGDHLLDCDLDFTKIAFTKDNILVTKDTIEAIDNRRATFPDTFRNVRHFMKVWLRAEKYKMRGFSIDYPKKITMENVIYNRGYDYDLPPSIKAMYDKIIDGKFFIRKERKSVFEKIKEKKVQQFNVETQTEEEMEKFRVVIKKLRDELDKERLCSAQMQLFYERSLTDMKFEMIDCENEVKRSAEISIKDMEHKMISLKEQLMKYKEMMGEIKSLVK